MDTYLSGPPLAETIRSYTQEWYGPVLVAVFLIGTALRSVKNLVKKEVVEHSSTTGPGGRPLPDTRKKIVEADDDFVPSDKELSKPLRRAFRYVASCVVLTFGANALAVILHTAYVKHWWTTEENIMYTIAGLFLHLYIVIVLTEGDISPHLVHCVFWTLALLAEIIILVCTAHRFESSRLGLPDLGIANSKPDSWDRAELVIGSVRLTLFTLLAGLYGAACWRRWIRARGRLARRRAFSTSAETTPLLNGHHANGHGRNSANGTISHDCLYQQDEEAAFYRPEKLPHKSWLEYIRGFKLFFPYLWPSGEFRLQVNVFFCFILLILQRAVNIYVPNQVGIVLDRLERTLGDVPWGEILKLILYKTLQGQSGLLGAVRSLAWIPVSQHCYQALTTAAFEHVHSLSLEFHTAKRTGEVLSALNKGASINSFLEQTTFQVFPMLVDLLVAVIYFQVKFGKVYATIATIVSFYYLHMTLKMASTRADQRRDMVNADREEEAVKNDSITSYETVKYFNAEDYEFKRYRDAIKSFQRAEADVNWGINNMNICQALVFGCGVLVVLIVGAFEVTRRTRTTGDFMVMITLLGQLQGPLNFFGTFYRTVQQAMISGERLLELFKIKPTVVDRAGVPSLTTGFGHIRWKNVRFWYGNKKPALKNLSFECSPGTTTAFVGESGGGKSTIFRLMFRYYECQEGSIEIDGHDVKDVTIDSVRRLIGVVPQDTILFNETIMYNLKYARQDATDEEVYEACRAASIHDRIMGFENGYYTNVGDRGLRLSGGEKQRVAIARTILKKPRIIMLDEATSALDSETEQQIQSKLIQGKDLGRDRTLLIIAHRLSTITHADQIIVLHNGAIVERGRHNELLQKHGKYASMWEKQSQAELAAEQARSAAERASILLRQAHISPQHPHSSSKQSKDDRSDGFDSVASSTLLPTVPSTPDTKARDVSDDARSSNASTTSAELLEDESSSTIKDRTQYHRSSGDE